MINQETRTINLERRNVCDVLMAITNLRCEFAKKMADKSATEECREIAKSSLQKWEKLHKEIKRQLEKQDEKSGSMNEAAECEEDVISYYEERNLELTAKIDELSTQLLQYQAYVADLTAIIQNNICKNFCSNINLTTN